MREPSNIRAELDAPLRACARGRALPNIALMRLLSAASAEPEAHRALDVRIASTKPGSAARMRLERLSEIWRRVPSAFGTVARMNALCGAAGGDCSGLFDAAARRSPEAGVALYSFGDAGLLTAATQEVVDQMSRWGILRRPDTVLDLGCGIGRIAAAIAPRVARVVGVDSSGEMVKLARARTPTCSNVTIIRGDGTNLAFFADESFELVLAIDSFPYLVEAQCESAHFDEISRILKPGGLLLIMNYSYRGDLARDRSDIGGLARKCALKVLRNGTAGLSLWDGRAFLLRRGKGRDHASRISDRT
ncbi:MAG TPA: class I SAM-dependent methyltransferase [Rhizomicrobium sp.]